MENIFKSFNSRACWQKLIDIFNLQWVFNASFKDNVVQISGCKLEKRTYILRINAVKCLLAGIWFERNQRVLHDKDLLWINRFEGTRLDASTWSSLSKAFSIFLVQDICLNWKAFTSLD